VLGTAKGVPGLRRLAGVLPKLNYTDGIFMPKNVFFVHTLLNYNLSSILSSRDPHELREKIVKCLAFDFFYYLGDDLLAGQAAKWLQKTIKTPDVLSKVQRGFLGLKFRHQIPLEEVYNHSLQQLGGQAQAVVKSPFFKAAQTAWLIGLAGTTVGGGLAVPLLNNWFTYNSIKRQQATTTPEQDHLSVQPANAPQPHVSPPSRAFSAFMPSP
jgi:hypothetical protein